MEITTAQNLNASEDLGVDEIEDGIMDILDSIGRRNGTFVNDTAEVCT